MLKFKARHNQSRNFENMVISFYNEERAECKIESFFTSGKQKKVEVLDVDVIVITVKQYSKQWDVIITSDPVKKLKHP